MIKTLLKNSRFVSGINHIIHLMGKCIVLTFLAFFLLACDGNQSQIGEDLLPVNSKYQEGKEVYDHSCIACHMKDGKGLESVFPPLTQSDYLLDNPSRALDIVLEGAENAMIVNGVSYHDKMPAQDVTAEEAVAVVNYILNAWGNNGGEVSLKDL
jgi:mono/diheme cytochrome c family protein